MAISTYDSGDGFTYQGATTGDTPTFRLLGGKYAFFTSAPSTSTTLQMLMPDNSTYQAVIAAVTALGLTMVDLPPGTYRVIFTATGAVQGGLIKIPYSGNAF